MAAGVVDPFPSKAPPRNIDFAASGLLPIGDARNVVVVDPHLHAPLTYKYGLDIEAKLAANTVLQVGYSGNTGHGLTALTVWKCSSENPCLNPKSSERVISHSHIPTLTLSITPPGLTAVTLPYPPMLRFDFGLRRILTCGTILPAAESGPCHSVSISILGPLA